MAEPSHAADSPPVVAEDASIADVEHVASDPAAAATANFSDAAVVQQAAGNAAESSAHAASESVADAAERPAPLDAGAASQPSPGAAGLASAVKPAVATASSLPSSTHLTGSAVVAPEALHNATSSTASSSSAAAPSAADASAARAAAYTDESLDRRTRGTISLARRGGKKPRAQVLDPKLQAMLDAYALEQAAAAEAAAARAQRSDQALRQTHRQVIIDGRMQWRPMTERERMQHVLSEHVGGARYEHGESATTDSSAPATAAPANTFDESAFQLLLDLTAPETATSLKPASAQSHSEAASSTEVEASVAMRVTDDGTIDLRVVVQPVSGFAATAAGSSAAGAALVDPNTFQAFVDVDVDSEGVVHTRIHLMSVRELQRLQQEHEVATDEDDDDAEASLVDLMDADSALAESMHHGGTVHTLDAFRAEREASRPANPPPSLLALIEHYVANDLASNPIGGMLYLGSFDWGPEGTMAILQWMTLLPKIAQLFRARKEEAEAHAAAEAKARGNLHTVSHSSNVGRFQRSTASAAVRAASSATLPANVVTIDQYSIDLRARGVLPEGYIPHGLDDMLRTAIQYGVDPLLVLLEKLGHAEGEIEAIRCYLTVAMDLVAEGKKKERDAQRAAMEGSAATGAASASGNPSSPPFTSPISSRTSSSSGARSNITTLSSLGSGGSGAASSHPPDAAKPAPRVWGSGHSLVDAKPAAAASATNALPAAASATAASSSSAATAATAAPHPDPLSLLPCDPAAPSTKLQLVLAGGLPPLVAPVNLSSTLGQLRQLVAAASGRDEATFDLVILRPRQVLTQDAQTIQQLKLHSAKITQVLK